MLIKTIEWTKFVSPITKFYENRRKKKKADNMYLFSKGSIIFEDEAPDKIFKIYHGDTNFIIHKQDFLKIARTPGIESCMVLTPYKVQIGIAQLFDEYDVIKEVNKRINPILGIHSQIIDTYKKVAEIFQKKFILYQDPLGMINVTNKENYDKTDGFLIYDSDCQDNKKEDTIL